MKYKKKKIKTQPQLLKSLSMARHIVWAHTHAIKLLLANSTKKKKKKHLRDTDFLSVYVTMIVDAYIERVVQSNIFAAATAAATIVVVVAVAVVTVNVVSVATKAPTHSAPYTEMREKISLKLCTRMDKIIL